MRETKFIEQNEEKWQQFERSLEKGQDSDELQETFVQITDDLSYAQTFYSNRSVRVYLNGLAQSVFFRLYKSRRTHLYRFVDFWTDELPRLVYESRGAFRLSLGLFVLAFLIGALSCTMDEGFLEVILGEQYVEMTRENIMSGDPMRVYKSKGELGMSVGITINNLFVAFLTFVMGVFYMLGSIVILVRNGIMVGAFQYFFVHEGVFWESFLTIWTHGTLEISAIIIAGAAGLTMGQGLVFPGTYTRMRAFQHSARRGLKIMLGIAPIIIAAGIIEGYLTRHTEVPDVLRLLFILLCLGFVLLYFVWYPVQKARIGFSDSKDRYRIPPDTQIKIDWFQIKSVGAIFADVILLYRRYMRSIVGLSVVGGLLYTLVAFFLSEDIAASFYFSSASFSTFFNLQQFFVNANVPYLFAIIIPILAILLYELNRTVLEQKTTWKQRLLGYLKSSVGATVLFLVFFVESDWLILTLPIGGIISLTWMLLLQKEETNIAHSFWRTFLLLSGSIMKALGLFIVLWSVSFIFFNLIDMLLLNYYFDLLSWIFHFEQTTMDKIGTISLVSLTITLLFLTIAFFNLGYAVLYHSLVERKDASHLKAQINAITITKYIKGIAKE